MSLRMWKDTPPWEWPARTGQRLIDTLRDDGAAESDILLAAELSGDLTVVNDELVDALLSVLRRGDRSETVRSRAAISLGPILEHADTQDFEDADDRPIAECTFRGLQESLGKLYRDANVPKEVRRRILEASVRAPQDWHEDAIRAAYSSGDDSWRLTAVFCMRFVRGFDEHILEALDNEDPDVHYEAVVAAGTWGLDAAWAHVATLVTSKATDKPLRLAAIEASASIRPREAVRVLDDLADSPDEDITAAAEEAMASAESRSEGEDDDDDDGPY
jgi:HEAT repeat protein